MIWSAGKQGIPSHTFGEISPNIAIYKKIVLSQSGSEWLLGDGAGSDESDQNTALYKKNEKTIVLKQSGSEWPLGVEPEAREEEWRGPFRVKIYIVQGR